MSSYKKHITRGLAIAAARSVYRHRKQKAATKAKSTRTNAITTDQHDTSLVYNRKKRAVNRKQLNFAKKVKKVMQLTASPQFQVLVHSTYGTSGVDKQSVLSLPTLLGSFGTFTVSSDIKSIFDREPGKERIHITGALMETMIANTGTTTAYVDCYYWSAKRNVPLGDAGNVSDLWVNGLAEMTANNPTGGSSLDIADYGVTPFQSRLMATHASVDKKVRIKLGAGETTQLKIGQKVSAFVNSENARRFSMLKGITRGILLVHYGTPDITNQIAKQCTICVSVNKNLTYRVLDQTVPTGGTNKA